MHEQDTPQRREDPAKDARMAPSTSRSTAASPRTCLFGGSFDPVHSGHLAMAQAALAQCGLDRVVFLPANVSPFKQSDPPLFSPQQRLTLLRLALHQNPRLEVSDLDLNLPPPSWTWRLVEHWRSSHPQDQLYWLMGTDQWNQLHRWARYEQLVAQLSFIVYTREGATTVDRPGVSVHFIEALHPASSSGIRACLRAGRSIPSGWMPPDVADCAQAFFARSTGF